MRQSDYKPLLSGLNQDQISELELYVHGVKDGIVFDENTGNTLKIGDGLAFFGISMNLANIAAKFGNEMHDIVVINLGLGKLGYKERTC